ncbi:MAG: glycosyltransferase, partial [Actinomycetota bacterium]|nr:glycosyltransferase [Actinomycetota bacterium]
MSVGERIRPWASRRTRPRGEDEVGLRSGDDRLLPVPVPGPEEDVSTPGHGRLSPSTRVRALLLLNLMAASFYVMWWVTPGRMGVPALFYLLGFAEAFNLIHLLGLWWALSESRYDPPPEARTAFSIDVFVATYGEPIDVLRKTIAAAVAMRGEHVTYVLDDGNRPEVRELARELGARYIRRETNEGAKAGNLNNALGITDGELVAVFDADHVPRRDFLTRILGYLEDPAVAFVQTPQFYGNGRENEIARGAFMQQAIFYGPICRGKHGLQAAFCCGTNVLFRRKALEDVGGFDEKSVVEDFVTSMRIHRRGWRSVYYPFVLAEGEGPSTVGDFFKQQFRWARGSIGALFSGEPFRRGFTLAQRVQYLLATTFYLIGLVTSIYIALPIIYLLTGGTAFSAHSGTFVFFYAPYLALALVTIRWGLGGQLRLEHLRYTFGTFPVYAMAAVASILHLPARFRVTTKGAGDGDVRPPLLAAVPVVASGITVIAIVAGLFLHPIDARSVINMSWGVINLLLMFGIVRATIREFLRRPARVAPEVASAPEPVLAAAAATGTVTEWERVPAGPAHERPAWWEEDGATVPDPGEAPWWEEEVDLAEPEPIRSSADVPWWETVLDDDIEPSLPETAFRRP